MPTKVCNVGCHTAQISSQSVRSSRYSSYEIGFCVWSLQDQSMASCEPPSRPAFYEH